MFFIVLEYHGLKMHNSLLSYINFASWYNRDCSALIWRFMSTGRGDSDADGTDPSARGVWSIGEARGLALGSAGGLGADNNGHKGPRERPVGLGDPAVESVALARLTQEFDVLDQLADEQQQRFVQKSSESLHASMAQIALAGNFVERRLLSRYDAIRQARSTSFSSESRKKKKINKPHESRGITVRL